MALTRPKYILAFGVLVASQVMVAQGPVVNSPADLSQNNNPANQAVTQNALPSPDTPTYSGPDIDRAKKAPPASDQTSGPVDSRSARQGAVAPGSGQ